MPLIVPKSLPSIEKFKEDGMILFDKAPKGITPLRVLLINLMPKKEETENDILRVLQTTNLWIEIILVKLRNQTYKNTSIEHMNCFYKVFDELKEEHFDGLILTGAPIEHLEFKEVKYWELLEEVFDWIPNHITSSIFICWGAQAALYHYYKIRKRALDKKKFGIFPQSILSEKHPFFREITSPLEMPHSRHTELVFEDINTELLIPLVYSIDTPSSILATRDNSKIFITGHLEYNTHTLENEYIRDIKKGLSISPPQNYYNEGVIINTWSEKARHFFNNWLVLIEKKTKYNE